MAKKFREHYKTYGNVFDQFTFRNLFLLGSKGHFDEETLSPLSIGKESNVFTAIRDGEKVVVKIYRLETADFRKMFDYIKPDPRYQNLAKRRRDTIFAWCQREYRNLLAARYAMVRAPLPIAFMKNILVMSFVGDSEAAHRIKDDVPANPRKFFEGIIGNMSKFYASGYIHGDLSKFNILNYNQSPVLIDFSQASPVKSPHSEEMLKRDIHNVCEFFRRHGVKSDEEEVRRRILK